VLDFQFLQLCPYHLEMILKDEELARRQWLTPIILATQEAEIRRIMV
jgi:hypothetical protein